MDDGEIEMNDSVSLSRIILPNDGSVTGARCLRKVQIDMNGGLTSDFVHIRVCFLFILYFIRNSNRLYDLVSDLCIWCTQHAMLDFLSTYYRQRSENRNAFISENHSLFTRFIVTLTRNDFQSTKVYFDALIYHH